MAQFFHAGKTLHAKVVYYGPALSGKTTNLLRIHEITDPDRRTKLFALNTSDDRTLFFDLLPMNIGRILDYEVRLQLYTVPGQVRYHATRRMVLLGADAVVFVADSRRSLRPQNLESLEDLRQNLEKEGAAALSIPVVFQYNKRDCADAEDVDALRTALNPDGLPSFSAVATEGEGVIETLHAVTERLVQSLLTRYHPRAIGEADRKKATDLVNAVFTNFLTPHHTVIKRCVPEWFHAYPVVPAGTDSPAEAPVIVGSLEDAPAPARDVWGEDGIVPDVEELPDPSELRSHSEGPASPEPLDSEEVLEHALRTSMEIAEQYTHLQERADRLREKAVTGEESLGRAYEALAASEERNAEILCALRERVGTPLAELTRKVHDALEAAASAPDMASETLQAASESTARLSHLVEELLKAPPEEPPAGEAGEVPQSAADIISRAVSSCSQGAGERGVTMEVTMEESLPLPAGDSERLIYCLSQAMQTAIGSTPEGASVRVNAARRKAVLRKKGESHRGTFVFVEVRDSGPGLEPGAVSQLFVSGLAAARSILRRLGGEIQARSAPGEGTTWNLLIPTREDAAPHCASREAS